MLSITVKYQLSEEFVKDIIRLFLHSGYPSPVKFGKPSKKDFMIYLRQNLQSDGEDQFSEEKFYQDWDGEKESYPDPTYYYKKWFGK